MKKISLKNLNLKEVEQLSREQLKNVLGGYTGGTTEDIITTSERGLCECDTNCFVSTYTSNPDCGKICEGLNNDNCYN